MATLAEYRRFLEANGYRAATVRAKVEVVSLAAAYADVAADELTGDDVAAWLGSRPRATWTRLKYLSHLRAWCRWAGIPDATAELRRPPAPAGIPKPVSQSDLEAMRAVARGRERAWLLLGAYCGLRAHESAAVAGEHLETMPDGTVLLRVHGKGGQTALVPVPDAVRVELERWRARAGSGRFWPSATGAVVTAAIRRLATRAGVECTSHQLRHRYGSAIYADTRDLLTTQRLMRHATLATTAGYVATVRDHDAAIVARLPGAGADPAPAARLRVVR